MTFESIIQILTQGIRDENLWLQKILEGSQAY